VKIDAYSFGRIEIGGETYRADLIVLPGRIVPDWWRMQGHVLHEEDLEEVFAASVTCLVVGTGAQGVMKVPAETARAIEARGIRLIAKPTAEAVKAFNRLQDGGRVAGAFHLTC
jgi:hypothetical protein